MWKMKFRANTTKCLPGIISSETYQQLIAPQQLITCPLT